jgi:hypothetical protein
MNEKILKIPYSAVRNDWNFLHKYLKAIGNPKYILVGDVDLRERQDIFDLGNLVGVEGYLYLVDSSIESLGELEFVGGSFSLFGCKNIKTLGKLKKVDGVLNLGRSSIESLGELEYVRGYLALHGCQNITTLGKLKKVEGDLYINRISISQSELDNVEVIGDIYR